MSPATVSDKLPALARAAGSLSRLGPPVLLLALTIGVFWRIALTDQYTWLNSPDVVNQVLPWFQEETTQYRHRSFPLWDMHHWDGQSLIGQDQPGVLFPLNWLLWRAPLDHGHISLRAANWYFVLIHYFAALFCYLFARDLGLSRFASICSGASFGLAGFMGNVDWPQMLNGGMWAPLVLLFAVRALNGRRPVFNMAAAGCLEGFSMWGGHHQLPTFTLLSVGFLLGFYVVFRGTRIRTAVALGLVCAIFTMLAGAPQLLPSYEYWSRGLRWVGSANPVGFHDQVPYVVFDQFSLNPAAVVGFFLGPGLSIGVFFVGITVLAFAILGVTGNGRDRVAPAFAVLAIAGLIFSLGKYSLFHGLLYSVLPLIDKSRTAAFAVFIVDLALAVLAGYGIDCFLNARHKIAAQLGVLANVLIAFGMVILLLVLGKVFVAGAGAFDNPFFALLAFSSVLSGCMIRVWRAGGMPRQGAMLAILGLVLFDIGTVTTAFYPHRDRGWDQVTKLSAHDDIAAFLRTQPGLFRIAKNEDDISYNFGDWFGLDEYLGYAGVTANIVAVHGAAGARALSGVAYYLGRAPRDSDPEPVFRGRSGVNVYRVPGAFPRAWAVHSAQVISSARQSGERLNVHGYTPVFESNVVNQLHDDDGLADTGAAKQSNFPSA